MFEDSSNHGTSIASLIVSNNGKVKGINKNVELYSARILDENKQAPISRVVEGIESRYSRINRYKLFKNPFNDGESTKEELFQKL